MTAEQADLDIQASSIIEKFCNRPHSRCVHVDKEIIQVGEGVVTRLFKCNGYPFPFDVIDAFAEGGCRRAKRTRSNGRNVVYQRGTMTQDGFKPGLK
jgi:hypothetical protein